MILHHLKAKKSDKCIINDKLKVVVFILPLQCMLFHTINYELKKLFIIWEEVVKVTTPSQQNGSYRPGKPLFDRRPTYGLRVASVESWRNTKPSFLNHARFMTKRTSFRFIDCHLFIRSHVLRAS